MLHVLAVDDGASTRTGTGTVTVLLEDINDNPPTVIDGPFSVSVAEDAAVKTELLQVSQGLQTLFYLCFTYFTLIMPCIAQLVITSYIYT